MAKVFRLYCEICNWQQIVENLESIDLIETKNSAVQTNIPKLVEGKTVLSKNKNQVRKFKCPNCGRLVIPKLIDNPQETLDEEAQLQKKREEIKLRDQNRLNGYKTST